jgi:outer membrane protein OmpA-like peptidoglycan-associated protein
MDDFGLILSKDHTYGYFSSNRYGGVGSDDVYKFLMKNITVQISGNTFVKVDGEPDKSKISLAETNVIIYDKTHNKYLDTLVSDNKGKFNIELMKGAVYEFRGEKGALIPGMDSLNLMAYDSKEKDSVDVLLIEPLPDVIRMMVEVRDKDSKELLKNATVYLMDTKTGQVDTYITDDAGKITANLKPETDYVMKGTKIQYNSDCMSFNSGKATKEMKKPERPIYLETFKVSQKFKIENVFFDLDKYNIRPDAAVELDKVVAFILEHPGITVELGSHTDSRGSDPYNLTLSDNRAKSSREYIVSKGVAPDAISYKGYGETQLTNKCDDGVKCDESLHSQNRRTEIKITGIKDLSPEEAALQDKNKKALKLGDDISDCNPVKILVVK